MNKNCLIYETLESVKTLKVGKDGDLMTLSGVFGVCGVRNNNKRVYEASNYGKMVNEMKQRIKEEGGIPGELEHPQTMNMTLENISHKITDINIDEKGVVTGTIVLLNTPKGKIAQAIVEGGLPLFISSRATGNIDKNGSVMLERIATYDLVGTPGFSQAKLHLNENQIAESINESLYVIYENNQNNNQDMELTEIIEKLQALEERVQELETENEDLQEQLEEINNASGKIDEEQLKALANGIQKWIVEEFAPVVENWIVEDFAPEHVKNTDINEVKQWIANDFAPIIENWIIEEFSPEVEKWSKTELATGIQNWIIEEFSPEVEKWFNESYTPQIQNNINESIDKYKNDKLSTIDETIKLLESIEPAPSKEKYKSNVVITEGLDEPIYIKEMPAESRVKWELASDEIKESINRRAKLYNFNNEGAIKRFWENINFDQIKPVNKVYENINPDSVHDVREKLIREQLRKFKSRLPI